MSGSAEGAAAPRERMWAQLRRLPRAYWLVYFLEMFERLAYYGVRVVIPIYIAQADEIHGLHFTQTQKGLIFTLWALVQSGVPVFSGGFAESAWTHSVRNSPSTTSTAMALAISPAAAPPMPSATMNNEPRWPATCVTTSGCNVALSVVRSATTNESSLCSRVRPTSVRPKTWTITSPVRCGAPPPNGESGDELIGIGLETGECTRG